MFSVVAYTRIIGIIDIQRCHLNKCFESSLVGGLAYKSPRKIPTVAEKGNRDGKIIIGFYSYSRARHQSNLLQSIAAL